jgi:hypothetical protein
MIRIRPKYAKANKTITLQEYRHYVNTITQINSLEYAWVEDSNRTMGIIEIEFDCEDDAAFFLLSFDLSEFNVL